MKDMFTFEGKIPDIFGTAALYRTSKVDSYSLKNKEFNKNFDVRLKTCQNRFGMKGDTSDNITSCTIRDGSQVLEVYRPSDSFWWRDLKKYYPERMSEKATLSDEKEAKELALKYIKDMGIDTPKANYVSIEHTTASSSNGGDRSDHIDTEVHVNFSYEVDGNPIFGPGAKMRISTVSGGELSSFLRFWRDSTVDKNFQVNIISPMEAMTRLVSNASHAQLRPMDFSVKFESMRFGYYSLPPFQYQKFLIPVYQFKGIQESALLGRRNIVVYRPAMELPPSRMKELGITESLDIERVLASTK